MEVESSRARTLERKRSRARIIRRVAWCEKQKGVNHVIEFFSSFVQFACTRETSVRYLCFMESIVMGMCKGIIRGSSRIVFGIARAA